MKRITQIAIITCTAILACYDLAVYLILEVPPTVSAVILEWSKAYPILPFVFGVLCGHLFF